jgi:hypothetical protein
MPLTYDEEPGSWKRLSEGWPEIKFMNDTHADVAFILCGRARVVPYGSYVKVGNTIRVETNKQLKDLEDIMILLYQYLRV